MSEIQQLVEMGATPAQARAALKKYGQRDVMRAAERIFDGEFDDVAEDEEMASPAPPEVKKPQKAPSSDGGSDSEAMDEDDDDEGNDYVDYDSDFGGQDNSRADVDPYAGIFFSKDRREEVIEVEEEPETYTFHETDSEVKLMTQGEWMRGCPEGGEQSFLFELYFQLSTGACACPQDGCSGSVTRKKSDFFPIFPEFSSYIVHLTKLVEKKCGSCRKTFCFACGDPISEEKTHRPSAATDDDPLFHCANLQGVILGVGLYMLETLFSEQLQDSGDNGKNTRKRKVATTSTPSTPMDDDDEEFSYHLPGLPTGKRAKGGVGYAGNVKEDHSGVLEAQALQMVKDTKISQLLTDVRRYLPNLRREGGGQTSDYLVHPTSLAHLRRRFNHVASTLLRNDSLSDICYRSVLYFELLHWLETISQHEALASMMGMPIMVVQSVSTMKSSSSKTSTIRERQIVYEGSASPRELLEAIAIQARAALKGLEGTKPAEVTSTELTEAQKRTTTDVKGKSKEVVSALAAENMELLTFCERVLATADAIDRSLRDTKGDAFVKRLQESLPKIETSSGPSNVKIESGASEETTMKVYMAWAGQSRFEYCDLAIPVDLSKGDEIPHYKFYFNSEARMLATSDIPKRSLAIAKELAVLTTNLPVAWNSSIFLRVDETRVDVIKCLITGPEDTPYYNGCYLFDIFLGSNYNQSSPSVKYMTTNGGKFRFNPNLYADGKVCLSLLGTWSGPGWVPGKSTLLQVLISVQSMILCEEPFLNEPAYENSGGTAQSKAYSNNCRRMVVRTAMIQNLKNPPEPFGDVIRTHFRLKAKSIAAQLDQWLAEDDGKPLYPDGAQHGHVAAGGGGNNLKKDVEEMKGLLVKLQSGDSLL